jgi:hypothetical protein
LSYVLGCYTWLRILDLLRQIKLRLARLQISRPTLHAAEAGMEAVERSLHPELLLPLD